MLDANDTNKREHTRTTTSQMARVHANESRWVVRRRAYSRTLMPDDAASKHFMLTAEQREQLIPNIDVGALERFLEFAANSTEERDALLRAFTRTFSGPNTSFQLIGVATADSARARAITALLDEIWAPTWEAWGRDAIAHSDSRLPGREIARARLAMKPPPGTD